MEELQFEQVYDMVQYSGTGAMFWCAFESEERFCTVDEPLMADMGTVTLIRGQQGDSYYSCRWEGQNPAPGAVRTVWTGEQPGEGQPVAWMILENKGCRLLIENEETVVARVEDGEYVFYRGQAMIARISGALSEVPEQFLEEYEGLTGTRWRQVLMGPDLSDKVKYMILAYPVLEFGVPETPAGE